MNKPNDNDLNKFLSKIKAVIQEKFKIKYNFGEEEVEEYIKVDTLLYTDTTTGIEYGTTYVDPDTLCFTNKDNPHEQNIYCKDELGKWQLVPPINQ